MTATKNADFAERLSFLMKQKKISRTKLSEETGISYEMIRRYCEGTAKPRDDKLKLIAEFLGVEAAELRFGNAIFSNVGKKTVVRKVRQIPVLSWVQAGLFAETGDLQYDSTEPGYDDDYPEGVYWLEVKGDSMEPRFYEGDMILIDPNRTAKGGDFVIAYSESGVTFKKLKMGFDEKMGRDYCQLIPLNSDYAIVDSRYVDFRINGVVLERKEKFV